MPKLIASWNLHTNQSALMQVSPCDLFSPRWKKLWRDLQIARGRMIMMVVAIAVSIFGVGTILSAYTILNHEITRNYMGTNPASAFIELDRADDGVAEAIRQQPSLGVADAEATSWIQARIEVKPNQWRTLLLFVVPDFNRLRLDRFQPEAGAWPPPQNTMLLERAALEMIKGKIGDTLAVQVPDGPKQAVAISGTVHDPGLAPAWQEETVYGYITPATSTWLGDSGTLASSVPLHILKVQMKDQPGDITAIDAWVGGLASWLKGQGYTVGEIRIPPPGKHPHQGQMNAILTLLLAFSFLALVLSAILTATMINGLLAQQIRQIGIMKAIGARSVQITGVYLALILALGATAVALGMPLGILAGRGLSGVIAELLNFTLYSLALPAWVYLALLAMGLLVPLLVALWPIARTVRTTVREILSDYGVSRESFGARGLDGALSKLRGVDNTLILALRNTFRQRTRLILTLGLLAAAGAMFMTGINAEAGWKRFMADSVADRRYDLEIRLTGAQPEAQVLSTIRSVPGVKTVETWNMAPTAVDRPDGLEIVRTYPDGGHGSFSLRSMPPESRLLSLTVLSGRWLQPGDANGIVLNQLAAAFFPNVKVGDAIQMKVNDRASTFRVIGLVRQLMTPATAYVLPETYAGAAGLSQPLTNAVFIVLDRSDAASVTQMTGAISQALEAQRMPVKMLIPRTLLEGASDAHIYVFIYSLIFMAVVMAVVGALGLMSSMGTAVMERTREFGVMRAVGARSRTVLRNVISEGLFTGLMSFLIAAPLSILPSLVVGNLLGSLMSRVPLTLVISPVGLLVWLVIIVTGSVAASAYPAWQASRLTVRETLAYV